MKTHNPLMYNEPEGFSMIIHGIPFCTPPQRNFQINSIIYESIMDKFDYLEEKQSCEIYNLYTHTLLIDKKVNVSGILFIEFFNQ